MDIDIYHDPNDEYYDKKRDLAERKRLLKQHVKKKKWILEGGFTAEWAQEAFEKADLVILIWPPLWKRWYNLVKRTVLGQCSKKQRVGGFLFMFVWTIRWEKKRYKFAPYKEKTIEFTKADDAIAWVKKTLV
jgi:hypothetical protein